MELKTHQTIDREFPFHPRDQLTDADGYCNDIKTDDPIWMLFNNGKLLLSYDLIDAGQICTKQVGELRNNSSRGRQNSRDCWTNTIVALED